MIAESLTVPDGTGDCSYAIFNLARCSRSMYDIINRWASCLVQMELTVGATLRSRELFPLTWAKHKMIGLNLLCTKLAGFCSFCNLKSCTAPDIEVSLCEACRMVILPLISHRRLRSCYTTSPSCAASKVLKDVPSEWVGLPELGRLYAWWNIQDLCEKGDLIIKAPRDVANTFHCEDYCIFRRPSVSVGARHWPEMVSKLRFMSEWYYPSKTFNRAAFPPFVPLRSKWYC